MTFGKRLTQLREENGYNTRKKFAEKLSIPETTLRNYETDAREPGHTFLKQMSDFFNVSADYLLGLTEEREKFSSHQLKSSEIDHIKKYRELDPHGKKMVDFTLQEEWERSTTVQDPESKVVPMAVKEDAPDYLTVQAAHNDAETTDEEVEKMRKDIEMMKQMRAHRQN